MTWLGDTRIGMMTNDDNETQRPNRPHARRRQISEAAFAAGATIRISPGPRAAGSK